MISLTAPGCGIMYPSSQSTDSIPVRALDLKGAQGLRPWAPLMAPVVMTGVAFHKQQSLRDLLMGTSCMPEWIGQNIVVKPELLGMLPWLLMMFTGSQSQRAAK